MSEKGKHHKMKFQVYGIRTQAMDGTYEVSIWSDGGQVTSFYGTKDELKEMANEIIDSIDEWDSITGVSIKGEDVEKPKVTFDPLEPDVGAHRVILEKRNRKKQKESK
jgi:hypothetical protein